MRIWTVRFDVRKFASAFLVDEFDEILEFILEWPDFEGQHLAEVWKTPRIKMQDNKPVGNFTDIDPGILVCDSFALNQLEIESRNEIEILSVENINKIDMYILNIVNLIDCLNESSSVIDYFETGRIMDIQTYAFFTENLKSTMLFKIPQFSRTEIFATDLFREKFLESSLTGLTFSQIYSD